MSIKPKSYLYQQLTDSIIGAAIDVHKELGRGFLERVYETALCYELSARGVAFKQQAGVAVNYRGRIVGHYIADILVENKVICEIKAAGSLVPEHEAQLLNYLKATGLRVGLLLNFSRVTLEVRRFIR